MNNAFLSIVADRNNPDRLLVRSRFRDDINAIFPGAAVMETPDADYRFRAFLPRSLVSSRLLDVVGNIDYPNFKDSVFEDWRHDLYFKIWRILYDAQKKFSLSNF